MTTRPDETRETFEAKLRRALRAGAPLGDLNSIRVIRTWLEICDGVDKPELPTRISDTLAVMACDPDWRPHLAACGLDRGDQRFHLEVGLMVGCYGRLREPGPAGRETEPDLGHLQTGMDGLQSSFAALDVAAQRLDGVCSDLDLQLAALEAELSRLARLPKTLAA